MAERFVVILGDEEHHATVSRRGGGLDIELDGTMHRVRLLPEGPPAVYLLMVSGTRHEIAIERQERDLRILVNGRRHGVGVYREGQRRVTGGPRESQAERREGDDGTWTLLSPMAGLVLSIEVAEGQEVEQNDVLLVIEAMKMNNEMRALRRGRVRKIHVLPGDRIDQGADLITLEPIDATGGNGPS